MKQTRRHPPVCDVIVRMPRMIDPHVDSENYRYFLPKSCGSDRHNRPEAEGGQETPARKMFAFSRASREGAGETTEEKKLNLSDLSEPPPPLTGSPGPCSCPHQSLL